MSGASRGFTTGEQIDSGSPRGLDSGNPKMDTTSPRG